MLTEDTHSDDSLPRYSNSTVYRSLYADKTSVVPFDYGDTIIQSPFEEPAYADTITGNEMMRTMQDLVMEVHHLRQELEKKAYQDEAREYLTKSLHKELQIYRESLHFKLLRPIFLDIISMYHDLGSLIKSMEVHTTGTQRTITSIESFQETIEEILRRYGVETFRVEDNRFLASQQRIAQVISTTEDRLDKCIARRLHKGFKYEDKILSPEIVTVYKVEQTK